MCPWDLEPICNRSFSKDPPRTLLSLSSAQTHTEASTVPAHTDHSSPAIYRPDSLCSSSHENEGPCQVRAAPCPRLYMGGGQKLPASSPWTIGPCTKVAYGAPDALLSPGPWGQWKSIPYNLSGVPSKAEFQLPAPGLMVSAGISSQIKPLPPSPDSWHSNPASGKWMPTASLRRGQLSDKSHGPKDSSCLPGNGGEPDGHTVL